MQRNIYLVGFMGCGKTTVGGQLAIYQGKKFQDIDALIVKEADMAIAEIFKRYGEDYFRTLETKTLYQTAHEHAAVIATGGGIIEREENRAFLKSQKVIYLSWSFDVLYERIAGDTSRPLVSTKEALRDLYERRQKYYAEVATDILMCDGETPYSVSKYLAERIR